MGQSVGGPAGSDCLWLRFGTANALTAPSCQTPPHFKGSPLNETYRFNEWFFCDSPLALTGYWPNSSSDAAFVIVRPGRLRSRL
jgi:hypothetical protein